VDEVALVARARRDLLLRAHRFRLRWEDLEDCYSQATLELIAHARRGGGYTSRQHLANVLEQRFVSRIHDFRRAVSGRSPMQAALETAMSFDADEQRQLDVVDIRAEVESIVLLRHELRRIEALARALSEDQRLVLAAQISQLSCAEFLESYGWSAEKYRKVAQRGRARLRQLLTEEESAVPPALSWSEGDTGTHL
jgi:DNA-directed RNA polymerase specialized sigma24 family protein